MLALAHKQKEQGKSDWSCHRDKQVSREVGRDIQSSAYLVKL